MSSNHLGFTDLLRLSLRVFAVKPLRTFLTILGTSVGIAAVVFLISLGYGLQYILLGKLVTTQDSLVTLSASYPEESNIVMTQSQVDSLSKMQGVAEVSRVSQFPGDVLLNGVSGLVVIEIIDPNYFRLSGTVASVGNTLAPGQDGVVLTSQAAALLDVSSTPGSFQGTDVSIDVTYQGIVSGTATTTWESTSTEALPVIGIVQDTSDAPMVIVPVADMTSPPPFYDSLLMKAANINLVAPLQASLVAQGLVVSAKLDLVAQAQKVLNAITIVLGVFGVTALVVSAIGMFNTMIVSFMERIYEVGIMKSLGATDRDIRNLFLMESVIMGLLGGGLGVLLGVGFGKIVNIALNIVASRLGGQPLTLFITPLWFVGLILGTSAFIGLVSGYWPARQASSLSPKQAFLQK